MIDCSNFRSNLCFGSVAMPVKVVKNLCKIYRFKHEVCSFECVLLVRFFAGFLLGFFRGVQPKICPSKFFGANDSRGGGGKIF